MKIAIVGSATNSTPYSEFIPLAKYLSYRGDEPFFLIPKVSAIHIEEKLISSGLPFYEGGDYYTPENSMSTSQVDKKNKHHLLIRLVKKITPNSVKSLALLLKEIRKYYCLSKEVEKVFSAENPDLLIVYGDRTQNLTPPAIKAMRKRSKLVFDIQCTELPLYFLYSSMRKDKPEYSARSLINKTISWLWPHQARKFGSETVLFYPWPTTLSLAMHGMLPKQPWLVGESWAHKHLMLSEDALNAHKRAGAKCDNALVVGQYSHDLLYQSYKGRAAQRKTLLGKYFDINMAAKLIIIALPQFYEHNLMPEEESHSEIKYIVLSAISSGSIYVLLSLHPKMKLERYLYLESISPNVKLARSERLSEILPAGEGFVSAFPSTLTWAAMCSVASLHLNYYKFSGDGSRVRGCKIVRRREDLVSEMRGFGRAVEPLVGRRSLPPFDGRSGERIFAAIHGKEHNV